MILDSHSAHTSKETRAYLAAVPNRFEFVFTPFHRSWLNLVETFFAKMPHQVLRHIQVRTARTVPVDSLHSFGGRVRPASYLGTAILAPFVFLGQ